MIFIRANKEHSLMVRKYSWKLLNLSLETQNGKLQIFYGAQKREYAYEMPSDFVSFFF